MPSPERRVLHVLPHPGGGGETYVDQLDDMPGYSFSRVFISLSPAPSPAIARGVLEAARQSRRTDLVHVHGDVAAGLCLPILAVRPSVVTLHGLNLARRLTGARKGAAVVSLHGLLRAADCTICVSRSERDQLIRVVGFGAAERAVVVHNGVRIPPVGTDAEREACRAELGIPVRQPVAVWVGALATHKDPLTAVRAANRAAVTLLVVGDGPLRSEVERAAGEDVRVLGQRRDVPRLLAAADIFLLTSLREGLSLSLLEAMAAGLAPVVTDLPENREAIGDIGIAVGRGDVAGFATALARLMQKESDRLARGVRAREYASRNFDVDEMVRKTRDVYAGVIHAGRR